ncbi:MAG: fimbrillin family protein [Bacteroidales bacterium]|nr:fimbrillin family protein [Bacteroidales bacterium]
MSIRKVILSASALAIAFASCTKNEMPGTDGRQIAFQTASYATRVGIEGTVFPTSESFGVYAWAEGTIGDYFMDNERISYNSVDGVWRPSTTYYWPKNTTIDFEGFYPYGLSGVKVAADKITYSGYDVEAGQQDVMYSSKSVGYGDNPDGSGQGIDGSNGVPIIFHHALSKVTVMAQLAFDRMEEEDGTVYEWELVVNKATIHDFYKKGGAEFTLASEPSVGIVEWNKPLDLDSNRVWTNDGALTSMSASDPVTIKTEEASVIIPEFFTLPQALDSLGHRQTVSVEFTLKTKRNGVEFLSENLTKSARLYLEEIPAWEINHKIIYTLLFSPVELGPGGRPSVITFDPAVDDWEVINASTVINV